MSIDRRASLRSPHPRAVAVFLDSILKGLGYLPVTEY
jgi:hypothetical protein